MFFYLKCSCHLIEFHLLCLLLFFSFMWYLTHKNYRIYERTDSTRSKGNRCCCCLVVFSFSVMCYCCICNFFILLYVTCALFEFGLFFIRFFLWVINIFSWWLWWLCCGGRNIIMITITTHLGNTNNHFESMRDNHLLRFFCCLSSGCHKRPADRIHTFFWLAFYINVIAIGVSL